MSEPKPPAPELMDQVFEIGESITGAIEMLANLATPFLRPIRSHWGVSEEIAKRVYPGDGAVPEPQWSWTHGIEIAAPVQQVWPWVVQLGQDKAGFYSYQGLENLVGCHVHNSSVIHPEWQALKPGDGFRLHPTIVFEVQEVLANHYFWVASAIDPHSGQPPAADRQTQALKASWLFWLEALDNKRCRMISRYRVAYSLESMNRIFFGPGLMEPIGFVMDRRMLEGIKARVEQTD